MEKKGRTVGSEERKTEVYEIKFSRLKDSRSYANLIAFLYIAYAQQENKIKFRNYVIAFKTQNIWE